MSVCVSVHASKQQLVLPFGYTGKRLAYTPHAFQKLTRDLLACVFPVHMKISWVRVLNMTSQSYISIFHIFPFSYEILIAPCHPLRISEEVRKYECPAHCSHRSKEGQSGSWMDAILPQVCLVFTYYVVCLTWSNLSFVELMAVYVPMGAIREDELYRHDKLKQARLEIQENVRLLLRGEETVTHIL